MSRRGSKRWNARLQARLQEITAEHNPEAVVFDGVWIYEGLHDLVVRDFGRPFIWSRRAMWKPERDESFFERSWIFDAIIEPGELAESMDFGLTVAQRRAVI